jgi:hypothetical protein
MSAELRPFEGLPGVIVAHVDHFEYALAHERVAFQDVPVGILRNVRLDLQIMLQQNNGTFMVTNAIAHDIAVTLVQQMRARGELNE